MNMHPVMSAATLAFVVLAGRAAVGDELPRGVVNLNNANLAELARLPGVGLGKAQRIVERRARKPFKSSDEIMTVKGFGRGAYKRLKPYLAVNGPTTLRQKVVDRKRPPRPNTARKAEGVPALAPVTSWPLGPASAEPMGAAGGP